MFVQRDMTLKRLSAIGTINERFAIGVRTFVTAEVGELGVRLRTELRTRVECIAMGASAYLAFPRFDAGVNIPMLFQARGGLETFAAIVAGVQAILALAGFAGIRSGLVVVDRLVHSRRDTPIYFLALRKLSSMTTYILLN